MHCIIIEFVVSFNWFHLDIHLGTTLVGWNAICGDSYNFVQNV